MEIHISGFVTTPFENPVGLHMVPRFQAIDQMTHRTTVLHHSYRVSNSVRLLGSMLKDLGLPFNLPKALFMSDCHDLPEALTNDVPTSVKRSATPEQRALLKLADRMAAERIAALIPQPADIPEYYPNLYDELEEKETIEARVVNYVDKNDGLHESVHEVVCGEFPDRFIPVIEAYRPDFVQLNAQNADWQQEIERVLGRIFDFPMVSKLHPKHISELDFRDADGFIDSVTDRNPPSYAFWLRSAKNIFRSDFLELVCPGWKTLPEEVSKSLELYNRRQRTYQQSHEYRIPVKTFESPSHQDNFDLELMMRTRNIQQITSV